MTDKKTERYDDLANRFGHEVAERVVAEEYKDQVDLSNHSGIRELREWGEAQREQARLEQEAREQKRQQALEAQAAEEMRATKARMKERYVRAGGDRETFEKEAWPKLKGEILHKKTLETEETYSSVRNVF